MKSFLAQLLVVFCVAVFPGIGFAQLMDESAGFQWKNLYVNPDVNGTVSFDDRVAGATGAAAESDVYGEVSMGVGIENLPARYQLSAMARYGYRSYNKFSGLNDDFYRFYAGVGKKDGNLRWKISADYSKSLNYNSMIDSAAGVPPDSLLVNQPNLLLRILGGVSYRIPFGERISVIPEYNVTHYDQETTGSGEQADWQVHRVILPVKYALSDRTLLVLGGIAGLQANKDEDGVIGTLYLGAENQATEKARFLVRLGIAAADYEVSGTDVSGVSDLKLDWVPTPKISTYIFGGNQFQPGIGGGPARLVYRAGYGVRWDINRQVYVSGSGIHDYQDAIGADPTGATYDGIRHFFRAKLAYKLVRWCEASVSGRYVNDELSTDQRVISIGLDFTM